MNLKVAFKIHPALAIITMAALLILLFSLFRGCKQSKVQVAAKEKAIRIADSALELVTLYKKEAESTKVDFQIREELLEGQITLARNQKDRTESELDSVLKENKRLIDKHKLSQYVDTAAVTVPSEYVQDCENCFTRLETTTKVSLRYKDDLNVLQNKYEKQNQQHQARFKQLEAEKLGFYNKVQSLAIQAKDATDKLKPHGKLYLSWGVIWGPWPKMGGAGLLYKNKYDLIWGAKWYYGANGHMIETTINFPLSLKFK